MERNIVQVARIRAVDAMEGDIVNRDPDSTRGWFLLVNVDRLHDGSINLSDGGVENSFSVAPLEIIGVQLLKVADVPEQPPVPQIVLDNLRALEDTPAPAH